MMKGSLLIWLAIGCTAFTLDWGLSWLLLIILLMLAVIGGILLAIYYASFKMREDTMPSSNLSKEIEQSSRQSTNRNISNLTSFMGVPEVKNKMIDLKREVDALVKAEEEITGIAEVDAQLNECLNYLIRDYVVPWSQKLSATGDNYVLDETLKNKLRDAIAKFATPFCSIDWVDFFTTQLVDDFATHLHLYRMALERIKLRRTGQKQPLSSDDELIETAFFEAEAELAEPHISHEAVSRSVMAETFYFESISDVVLSQLLPPRELESSAFRLLSRSVLTWAVFRPSLEAIANPDLFNRTVNWICRATPVPIEHFTVITRTSNNADELTAVLERVSFELSRCHAVDALTESHELREQLAALYQLQQLCDRRLLELQMPRSRSSALSSVGVTEFTGNLADSEISANATRLKPPPSSISAYGLSALTTTEEEIIENRPSNASSVFSPTLPVIQQEQILVTTDPNLLTLNEILNNPALLDNFSDYLKTRKLYRYLAFYLNAQAFATAFTEAIHLVSVPPSPPHGYDEIEVDSKSVSFSLASADSISLISSPDSRSLPGVLGGSITSPKASYKSLAHLVSSNAGQLFENYLSPRADPTQRLRLDDSLISKTYAKIEKTILYLQNVDDDSMDILQTVSTDLFSEVTAAVARKLEMKALPGYRDEIAQLIKAERSASGGARQIFGSDNSILSVQSKDSVDEAQKSGSSLPASPNVSNNNQIAARIIDANRVLKNTESFVVYVIHVSSMLYRPSPNDNARGEDLYGKVDGLSWNTSRRYNDFAELHSIVKDRFPTISSRLHFPKKLLFKNMSDEVISKRMRELGDFMAELLRETTPEGILDKESAASLKMMLLLFLQPGPWDRCGDANFEMTQSTHSESTKQSVSNQETNDNSRTLLNGGTSKIGQMFKAIKNIPDRVDKTVDKLFSFMDLPDEDSNRSNRQGNNPELHGAPRLTSDRTSVLKFVLDEVGLHHSESHHASLGVGGMAGASQVTLDPSLNIPMRILLRLGQEIFDLGSPRHDTLRTNFAGILTRIIVTTYGSSLNKKIISQVDWLTDREQVVTYIKSFRDMMWPGGKPATSSLAAADDKNAKTQEQSTRHPHSRTCARLVCKSRMMGLVPDEIRTVLGAEATREAIVELFELFQHPTLNRRLVIVIFESLLKRLYPQVNFDEVFRRLHQNAKARATTDLLLKASALHKSREKLQSQQ